MRIAILAWLGLAAQVGFSADSAASPNVPAAVRPVVEVEEEVYSYQPADNGSGPMWCGGSTCLVRIGEEVFASGVETLEGFKPLNNCRWTLFKRMEDSQQCHPSGQKHRRPRPSRV